MQWLTKTFSEIYQLNKISIYGFIDLKWGNQYGFIGLYSVIILKIGIGVFSNYVYSANFLSFLYDVL